MTTQKQVDYVLGLQSDILEYGHEYDLKVYSSSELTNLNHKDISIIIDNLKKIHSEYHISDLKGDMIGHYYDSLGGY